MLGLRGRWGGVCFGWALLFGVAAGSGCGGPQPLGKSGDPCVRAADCAPGLVCIASECSSDLSEIGGDSMGPPGEEAPGGAGPGGASASGGSGAGTATGGTPSTGGGDSTGGLNAGGAAGSL